MTKQRHEWEHRATDNTKGAVRSVTGGLQRINSGLMGVVKGYGAVGVAGVAMVGAVKRQAEAFYRFIDAQAKLGDEMDKFSARTGESVELLSQYKFAVERGGGSVGDLENGMKRLSRAMGDAQAGTKTAVDAFAQLGISVDQLSRGDGSLKSFGEMMPLIADGLKNIKSQAQRMDLVQEIGGRGGSMLLPFLQDGAEGIRAMRVEMEKYGGAMSGTFTAKSAEFADAQTNLSSAAQRLKEALSQPFLGPFTAAVNDLAATIGAISSLQKTGGFGSSVVGLVPGGFGGLGNFTRARRAGSERPDGSITGYDYLGTGDRGLGLLTSENMALPPRPSSGIPSPGRSHAASDLWDLSELTTRWNAEDNLAGMHESFDGLNDLLLEVEEGAGGLTRGMEMLSESQAMAAIEAERLANMSGLARTAIEGISTSFNQALYMTLTDTRKFGRDFVDIMRRVFADALANAAGNLVGKGVTGVVGSIFSKSLADPGSKSMPGAAALVQQGRMASAAETAYGKAYA